MPNLTNYPLAWQAVEYIRTHRDQYCPLDWAFDCGTVRCFAGWVTHLAGWELGEPEELYDGTLHYENATKNGVTADIAQAACAELGMPYVGSVYWPLFAADTTLFELLDTLVRWANEDGVEVPASVLAFRAVALAEYQADQATLEMLNG